MRVGSSPDNDGTGWYCQTARVRQARREGVRVQKPVVEPPQVQNRLQPGGCGPDRSARLGEVCLGDFVVGRSGRRGGHEESLRRTHGDAVGEKLGASPVERLAVNVGTVSGPPSPAASQAGGGQARCRLSGRGPGGAFVVVRGRESRSHGEGRQLSRRRGTGRSGGRR